MHWYFSSFHIRTLIYFEVAIFWFSLGVGWSQPVYQGDAKHSCCSWGGCFRYISFEFLLVPSNFIFMLLSTITLVVPSNFYFHVEHSLFIASNLSMT